MSHQVATPPYNNTTTSSNSNSSIGSRNPSTETMTISAVPTLRVMRLQKPELHASKTSTILSSTLTSMNPPFHNSTSASTTSTIPTSSTGSSRPPQLPSTIMMMESNPSILQSALCLPDSLTVYVGETFTAYLGVLNTPSTTSTIPASSSVSLYPTIRRLSVVAQLQTPSHRYPLPSRLDPQTQQSLDTTTTTTITTTNPTTNTPSMGNNMIDVPPFGGVDAIVSRPMEEPGPHILRIEVGYYSPPDLLHHQTFRKFYRFNVKLPILITEKYTVRSNDTSCYTCIEIECPLPETTGANTGSTEKHHTESLVVSNIQFITAHGLMATNVSIFPSNNATPDTTTTTTTTITTSASDVSGTAIPNHSPTALDLWDQSQIMLPGSKISYIYHIQTNTPESTLRGIAVGDTLGHISLEWSKAMGEHGTIQPPSSVTIRCPAVGMTKYDDTATTTTNNALSATTKSATTCTGAPLIMYRSGRSVDVAATAANQVDDDPLRLITIEPVDPPLQMQLYVPVTVPLLVVNHSRHPCTVQIQFNIPPTQPNKSETNCSGIVIAGTTYQNIGTIPSHGGSTVTNFTFLPIQTGLMSIQHCSIMDVTSSGRSIPQPPLWTTYVTMSGTTEPNSTI